MSDHPKANEKAWRVEFTERNGRRWSTGRHLASLAEAHRHAEDWVIEDGAARPRVYYGRKRPNRQAS